MSKQESQVTGATTSSTPSWFKKNKKGGKWKKKKPEVEKCPDLIKVSTLELK